MRKLRKAVTHVTDLKTQLSSNEIQYNSDNAKLDKLKKIKMIMGRIDAKMGSSGPVRDIESEDVIKAILALKTQFPEEFKLLGLIDTIPYMCQRLLSDRLGDAWDPLMNPEVPTELFSVWFLGCAEIERSENEDSDNAILTSLAPSLVSVFESLCLFKIRRCLSSVWNVKVQSEAAANLLLHLKGKSDSFSLISVKELQNLLSTAVMPKLKMEVERWNPTTDRFIVLIVHARDF